MLERFFDNFIFVKFWKSRFFFAGLWTWILKTFWCLWSLSEQSELLHKSVWLIFGKKRKISFFVCSPYYVIFDASLYELARFSKPSAAVWDTQKFCRQWLGWQFTGGPKSESRFLKFVFLFISSQNVSRSSTTPWGTLECKDWCQMKKRKLR